jgi:N,N'-diacetyllegionaminate synthase
MNRVLIIAEAGVNHNGDMKLAKELILEAKKAGADIVKFQTFKTELNISKTAVKADYQISNTGTKESQFEMVKKLELSFDNFIELKGYCDQLKIEFLSTGFDFPSIDFLDRLGSRLFKVPSGEITNKPYLQHVARKRKEIILSTGMATLQEVKDALEIIVKEGIKRENITVLHCNTDYPTQMEDVNLLAMNGMARELGVKVGYSDHTLGVEVPIASVALGACVIEKHFTLDRTFPGPDHAASLEPQEFETMVRSIRNIEKAINGSGIKTPSASEKKNISIARKSIHVNKRLTEGSVICKEDLIALRPGDGISPMNIDKVIGLKVNKTLEPFTKLLLVDLINY